MKKSITITLLAICTSLLTGCATSTSPTVYSPGEAQQKQSVIKGRITHIEAATIQSKQTGAGAGVGAAAGGIAGYTTGNSRTSGLAGVGGALIGGAVGHLTEKYMNKEKAVKLEIETDGGEIFTIVQADDVKFQVGDRVRITKSSKSKTRVTKEN